jgi:HD superfamily phosphohydrolase YqeK
MSIIARRVHRTAEAHRKVTRSVLAIAAHPGINLPSIRGGVSDMEILMVRRHTRRKFMTDTEKTAFASDCVEMHRKLMPLMHALTPLSDDYRAVVRLSDALMSAIRDITGEEPNLSKVSKTWYPG